jgi:hypothetical protein
MEAALRIQVNHGTYTNARNIEKYQWYKEKLMKQHIFE